MMKLNLVLAEVICGRINTYIGPDANYVKVWTLKEGHTNLVLQGRKKSYERFFCFNVYARLVGPTIAWIVMDGQFMQDKQSK